MMELIGRIGLIAAMIASPWAFGSVTPDPLWFLGIALGGLLVWRLAESVLDSSGQPQHLPVVVLAPIGLLLIASIQLLPREEALVAGMDHDVFGEWSGEVAAEGPRAGTVSPVTTRTQAALLFFAMGAFLLGSIWFATPSSQKWLWAMLALNGAALGFFGIVQKLTWNGMLFWRVPLRFGGTPFASFVNRNNAAGYLNLCLAAGLGWLLLTWGTRDDEWVFSGYSFTEMLWIDTHGKLHEGAVPPEHAENLWGVGFYHNTSRDAFITLRLDHSAEGVDGPAHGGEPILHYDGHGQL